MEISVLKFIHSVKPSRATGVERVDNVIGRFQEMQAQLSEGRQEIVDEAARKSQTIRRLQAEVDALDAKADEAAALESSLRALTNGLEGV